MVDHLAVGRLVQMFRERLGLHGRHVGHEIPEGVLVIPLSRTRKIGGETLFRKILDLVGDDFTDRHVPRLEPRDLAAREDPAFEFEVILIYSSPSLDPEELGMQGLSIDQHGVGLK